MSDDLQTQKQEATAIEGIERTRATQVYVPYVDILSNDAEIVIYADMPGIDEKNVDITLEKNVLTISGYVSATSPAPEGYELVHNEYGMGDFQRSFTLPEEIDRDHIEASLQHGVLRVDLPKVPEAQARKITVKTR